MLCWQASYIQFQVFVSCMQMGAVMLPMSVQMAGPPPALGAAYAAAPGGGLGVHMPGAQVGMGYGLGAAQVPMGGQAPMPLNPNPMLMSAPMPYPAGQALPGSAFAAPPGETEPQVSIICLADSGSACVSML